MESLRELFKIGFGPSSSHTMGPQRAASKIKEQYPNASRFEVELYGSLALTGKGHLTDYIIKQTLGKQTIVRFKSDRLPYHPNGMKFYVYQDEKILDTITAYSIGGGTVEYEGSKFQQTKQIYPHKNLKEIIQYIEDNGISFYDYVLNYEDEYFKAYLFDVLDGNAIETVLMEYHHGKTLCVSSQIGCKMGCKFCASTGIPFVRNLSSGEIVEQILAVEQEENTKISNIVFMGIGEPFDNFDNVINAIGILNNPKGLNIGARHISISTSGIVPKIYELADKKIQCTLSISLHATNDDKRSAMMPVNNAYPIKELMKACKYYIEKTNKRISFEYALAKDNNDNLEDAKELVKLLHGMLAHVNLIPINKIENGKFVKSTDNNIIRFRDYLNAHGIVATIRRELGSDIEAACGQLRRKTIEEKR